MDDRRIRILVADDHTLLREALCDVLRTEPDFEIVADVGDGDTVVQVAAGLRPDVILLDVEMPGTPRPTPSRDCSGPYPRPAWSC